MAQFPTYSRKQWVAAVNLSALLAWAIIAIPMTFATGLSLIFYAAIYGLPISFICCWVVGAPILKRVMRKKISWIKALSLGSAIALIIAGASIIIGRFLGWRQSLNPDTNSVHGGEHVLEIDGILTVFGWLMLAQSTALFTGLGATVALFVWWLVGEPSAISGEV